MSRKRTKGRRTGRPAIRLLPPRVDATPEEMARAIMNTPPKKEWQYEQDGGTVYRCKLCGKEVYYPDVLYRDDTCASCHVEE